MQSQRFFIGNLPPDTSENELHKALQNYGTITNVELKKKENLVDPENVKVLAFVTLNLYDGDVESCLRKISSKPINGQYVNVSVAKESFLERLKREREENASHKIGSTAYTPSASPIFQPPNKSKKFAETEENGDAEICEHDDLILITKKRAANSMRNGKIVIESTNSTPVHVIGKSKDVKHLSEKSFDADKKRKESVNKKKNQYQLQKSLIQKSLSAVDTVKTKKIIFSDDNEVGQSKTSNVKSLFQDDADQEENSFANDFSIKSEYEGSHGAALMKLQANMNLDPRFKIDHKFVENVDKEIIDDKNNERDWQYEILGQVVGSRVSNPSHPKGNEKKKLKMLRYDPSKANQDEFLVKRKETQPMEVDDENSLVPVEKSEVSKEVFYMVSDNLANSLKTRGDGFSLLSMFGNNDEEKEKLTNGLSKEKILISKNDKSAALNPFTYDSSESENEQEGHLQKPNKKMEVNNGQNQSSIEPKNKLFVESFFIAKNDVRLKEGKTFFRCNERTEKAENYDEIKDKLKAIINTKINKSKRQLRGTIKKKSMRNR